MFLGLPVYSEKREVCVGGWVRVCGGACGLFPRCVCACMNALKKNLFMKKFYRRNSQEEKEKKGESEFGMKHGYSVLFSVL